ncbi:MAG TPA: delta-60 repeat domain-containing protein, partial [Chthoniobacteraceae bacterium]
MKIFRLLSVLAFLGALLTAPSALRAQSAGTIDASLNASIAGSGGNVSAIAVQPDGNIIIAGLFSSVGGVPRGNIARISQDGTLDPTFNPKTNGQVNCAALQPDGSIVIGGTFTSLQPNGASAPTTRNYVARIHTDGSLDTTFNPNADNFVNCAAVQADGKIVLGGSFQFFGFTLRQCLARFNADGSVDASFSPQPDSAVYSIIVRSDRELLVGGQFNEFNSLGTGTPVTRHSLALLLSDGTVDTSFDPEPSGRVAALALQPNGQVILGGDFDHLQPKGGPKITQFNIARVNADGSLDTTFAPTPGSGLDSLVLQTNGQIVISGAFTYVRPAGGSNIPRNRIARLNSDGSVDSTFDPNANGEVDGVAFLPDGEVLIGGSFTSLQPDGAANPTTGNFLALLNNDPATQSLTAPDATQIQWLRGGASPEITSVLFERSPDGENWFPLGAGTQITGGWQLTGLDLSGLRGTILALAQAPGGLNVSSPGSLVETASFDFDTVGGFTVMPTLIAPASNSATKSPVTVSFTLPETALSGSVKLKFGSNAQTLVLSSTEETAGTHVFTFDPANPVATSGGAVASIASGNILDLPNYTVTLSYQDTLSHPAASVTSSNVDIDTITQTPQLSAPLINGTLGGPFGSGGYGFVFNLLETALPGSVQVTFDNGS